MKETEKLNLRGKPSRCNEGRDVERMKKSEDYTKNSCVGRNSWCLSWWPPVHGEMGVMKGY